MNPHAALVQTSRAGSPTRSTRGSNGVNDVGTSARSYFGGRSEANARATVDLPVNVPIGRYTSTVYLFRGGLPISKKESTLDVSKVGFERMLYTLAFIHPFLYGLLAVTIAMIAGLIGWLAFGERMTPGKALAALTIVAGVIVTRL